MSAVRRTNDEWRALLAEQRASGQAQIQWCAENGVNFYTLRDRARRLKRQDQNAAGQTDRRLPISAGWVEVRPETLTEAEDLSAAAKGMPPAYESVVSETAAEKKTSNIRITRGDWTVSISAGFEAGLLADVLRVVNRVCC
jgi:hypothetical protein